MQWQILFMTRLKSPKACLDIRRGLHLIWAGLGATTNVKDPSWTKTIPKEDWTEIGQTPSESKNNIRKLKPRGGF
jgi:hypothetical protein